MARGGPRRDSARAPARLATTAPQVRGPTEGALASPSTCTCPLPARAGSSSPTQFSCGGPQFYCPGATGTPISLVGRSDVYSIPGVGPSAVTQTGTAACPFQRLCANGSLTLPVIPSGACASGAMTGEEEEWVELRRGGLLTPSTASSWSSSSALPQSPSSTSTRATRSGRPSRSSTRRTRPTTASVSRNRPSCCLPFQRGCGPSLAPLPSPPPVYWTISAYANLDAGCPATASYFSVNQLSQFSAGLSIGPTPVSLGLCPSGMTITLSGARGSDISQFATCTVTVAVFQVRRRCCSRDGCGDGCPRSLGMRGCRRTPTLPPSIPCPPHRVPASPPRSSTRRRS